MNLSGRRQLIGRVTEKMAKGKNRTKTTQKMSQSPTFTTILSHFSLEKRKANSMSREADY